MAAFRFWEPYPGSESFSRICCQTTVTFISLICHKMLHSARIWVKGLLFRRKEDILLEAQGRPFLENLGKQLPRLNLDMERRTLCS
jgi:hypothetical protein